MNGDDQFRLIKQIHDADARSCLVITGAGTSAISAPFLRRRGIKNGD